MELATPRLILRPLEGADLPALMAAMGDWDVQQWLLGPSWPYTEEMGRRWIARVEAQHDAARTTPGEARIFAIAARDNPSRLIGQISGDVEEDEPSDIALSYWYAREAWGRGYASEALKAMIDHLFAHTAAASVSATADPANVASLRVMEKAGLSYAGPKQRRVPTRRGSPSSPLYRLTREAYAVASVTPAAIATAMPGNVTETPAPDLVPDLIEAGRGA